MQFEKLTEMCVLSKVRIRTISHAVKEVLLTCGLVLCRRHSGCKHLAQGTDRFQTERKFMSHQPWVTFKRDYKWQYGCGVKSIIEAYHQQPIRYINDFPTETKKKKLVPVSYLKIYFTTKYKNIPKFKLYLHLGINF